MDYRKKPQETAQGYVYRICKQKDAIGTWNDVRDILNAELDRDWTESAYRKQFQAGLRYLDEFQDELSDDEILAKIREEKELLCIERKKLQRVNQEYQANLRRAADYQLYKELWLDAIADEDPIHIVQHQVNVLEKVDRIGVLCISDAHYGKIVELKGLDGEIINSYSPEIFEARMWKLLCDFENDCENILIDKLVVLDLGDCIEGILRCDKTLRSLKTGVVESANRYGNFMATWLCELYNRIGVPVEYSLCGGNHDVLRILGDKKKFDDENIVKNICEKIHDRVEISKLKAVISTGAEPDITVCDYGDVAFKSIYNVNILGYHGDHKNLKEDIEFFENYYQVGIDILVGGHLHRNSQETIGYGLMGDREIIRVPSLIGADEYSKSIRKISRAGAFYMTFTQDGKDWSKTYFLN